MKVVLSFIIKSYKTNFAAQLGEIEGLYWVWQLIKSWFNVSDLSITEGGLRSKCELEDNENYRWM